MKVLSGKRVYLSGPIELNTDLNWREEPKKILTNKYELDLFDPFADMKQQHVPEIAEARKNKDYNKLSEIAHKFVRKDLSLVQKSDVLIAYLPYRISTFGTTHEIINANQNKCPTLLVCNEDKEKIPIWFYGFIPHEFMFSGWNELYNYLDEVNDGKHIKNDRWAYVYGLI